jgi:hypothetical protein
LFYDLDEGSFTVKSSPNQPWLVPLPVLFDLQELLRWFADDPELKDRFDQATEVAKVLRQYQVPAYVVRHDDEKVLQDIFDRMNNYGKRLTKAEVFSALNAGGGAADDSLDLFLMADRIAAVAADRRAVRPDRAVRGAPEQQHGGRCGACGDQPALRPEIPSQRGGEPRARAGRRIAEGLDRRRAVTETSIVGRGDVGEDAEHARGHP